MPTAHPEYILTNWFTQVYDNPNREKGRTAYHRNQFWFIETNGGTDNLTDMKTAATHIIYYRSLIVTLYLGSCEEWNTVGLFLYRTIVGALVCFNKQKLAFMGSSSLLFSWIIFYSMCSVVHNHGEPAPRAGIWDMCAAWSRTIYFFYNINKFTYSLKINKSPCLLSLGIHLFIYGQPNTQQSF